MPSTRCCVYACNANGGHKFPKELDRRKLWTIAVRRANWQPTATSVVCFRHFTPDDYQATTVYGKQKAYFMPFL